MHTILRITLRFLLTILVTSFSLFARETGHSLSLSTVTFEPPSFSVRAMAEWEPLQGIMMTWDEMSDTASCEGCLPIDFIPVLTEIVRHAQKHTRVFIICNDPSSAERYLRSAHVQPENVELIRYGHNSVWARDFGPWSVYHEKDMTFSLVDFLYSELRYLDDQVSRGISQYLNVPLYEGSKIPNNIINDGGNFMVDGHGRAFTSKQFLQSNHKMNQSLLKERLYRYMGIDDLVILPWESGEHIDMYMKLLDEETLLVGEYPPDEENGLQIEPNLKHITSYLFTPYERPYRIFRVPMPNLRPGYYFSDQGGYRTYTNSIIINDLVLVPVFGLPEDAIALDIYRQAMPGYNIVGINCDELILSAAGALHCMTREIGAAEPTLIQHGRLYGDENQGNGFEVRAEIRSSKGIAEASLWYRSKKNHYFEKIDMQQESTHVYTAKLPLLALGSTLQYYIQASDQSGVITKKPLSAPDGYYEFTVKSATAVKRSTSDYHLVHLTNFPNPFNLSTCIQYTLPEPADSKVQIFNVRGSLIRSWEMFRVSGSHSLIWDGLDQNGEMVSSGTYFVRVQSRDQLWTRKILMIK
ncbi:T9SS type A sorting domain-containing protein [candidate division KSB1 bacterium]|nr:T9SS type A sorting domain-containing protein [candidate division KSB1 bacterium]